MVDGNRSTTVSENQSALSPPRIDEHASLKAQPVMPIPKSRMAIFLEKAGQLFAGSSRSLALIVVLGIATGALVGMALVRERRSPLPGAVEQALILPDVDDRPQMQAAEVGVYGIQTPEADIRRTVNRRSRVHTNGRQRAYRFGVIR
jgi:hypothetical protein